MAEIFAIQVSKSYITLLLPTNSRMHPIDSGWRSLIVSFSNGAHNAEHLVGRKDRGRDCSERTALQCTESRGK